MKRLFFIILMILCGFCFAQKQLPVFYQYQEEVYAQNLSEEELNTLYFAAADEIKSSIVTIEEQLSFLAWLEQFRGNQHAFFMQNEAAVTAYENGIKYAEQALKIKQNAHAYTALAHLYSFMTAVKKMPIVSTGIKIDDYTKKALKLDPKNPAANYMAASVKIYAPPPFGNIKQGIQVAETALVNAPSDTPKTDIFNLTVIIAHANYLLKQPDKAEIWREKAAQIFPNNKSLAVKENFVNE